MIHAPEAHGGVVETDGDAGAQKGGNDVGLLGNEILAREYEDSVDLGHVALNLPYPAF
jgi:hypothetical protein